MRTIPSALQTKLDSGVTTLCRCWIIRYGVNSGTGRSGKVLRRMLGLPDDSSTVTDAVITAAGAADPKILIGAICDERLRFLQALKTWPVFGAGWGRRVAEVKLTALKMVADAAKASTMARTK